MLICAPERSVLPNRNQDSLSRSALQWLRILSAVFLLGGGGGALFADVFQTSSYEPQVLNIENEWTDVAVNYFFKKNLRSINTEWVSKCLSYVYFNLRSINTEWVSKCLMFFFKINFIYAV